MVWTKWQAAMKHFFDLFSEIVIRMEQQAHLKYDLPGIVLIDEIELHLHIAWQKKVLPFLVRAFPNLQFIVATHSPFVVSSIESAVIYDLEKYHGRKFISVFV